MSQAASSYWEIEPGAGVGPLRLGMRRAEVRKLLGERSATTELAGGRSFDVHGDLGMRVYYDGDSVAGAELFGPVAPLLHGEPLLGRSLPSAAKLLRRWDPAVVVEDDGLTSHALGVALYVPAASRRPEAVVESVLVRRPGPPPEEPAPVPAGSLLVLARDVPFPVVDLVLGDLGLRGGATTALPPLIPGEPEVAVWEREGAEVVYAFDPVTFLRTLEIRGDLPADVRAKLADRLPHLDTYAVTDLLFSRDDEGLARGVQAARVLGLRELGPRIEQLRHSRSPVVATLADQAAAALQPTSWP